MLLFLDPSNGGNHPRVNAVIDRMDQTERDKLIAVTERWSRLLSKGAFSTRDEKSERPVVLPRAPFVDSPPTPQVSKAKEPEAIERIAFTVPEPPTKKPAFGQFSVLDLTRNTCRAPMTCEDGLNTVHRFCGRRVESGLQYCSDHAKMCYLTVSKRTRERLLVDAFEGK